MIFCPSDSTGIGTQTSNPCLSLGGCSYIVKRENWTRRALRWGATAVLGTAVFGGAVVVVAPAGATRAAASATAAHVDRAVTSVIGGIPPSRDPNLAQPPTRAGSRRRGGSAGRAVTPRRPLRARVSGTPRAACPP